MNHIQCEICGKEVIFPFKCSYCEGYFCNKHRLPESHNCTEQPIKNPHKKERHYEKKYFETSYQPKKRHSKRKVIKKIVKFSVVIIVAIFLIST
jgi:predicted nucleic acid binding AN1-type Zn finger protein